MNPVKREPGDVVKLKSGGPWMTVQGSVAEKEEVICSWFDEDGPLHVVGFHPASLTGHGKP